MTCLNNKRKVRGCQCPRCMPPLTDAECRETNERLANGTAVVETIDEYERRTGCRFITESTDDAPQASPAATAAATAAELAAMPFWQLQRHLVDQMAAGGAVRARCSFWDDPETYREGGGLF